jgi:hypothetical protein
METSTGLFPKESKMPLPRQFRRVRLELAREPGHPEGSRRIGYDMIAPLDEKSRLSPELWRQHRDQCRVRRFDEGQDDRHGLLSRKPGGAWYIDYDPERQSDDESGHRLGDEHFVTGEYVSIADEHHKMRTYSVVAVEPL